MGQRNFENQIENIVNKGPSILLRSFNENLDLQIKM